MAEAVRIVPVVAHRIYGTRLIESTPRPRRRPLPSALGEAASDLPPASLPGRTIVFPEIDRSIGTSTTLEQVRAFFQRDPSLPYTGGFTVNDLFPQLLRFSLVEIVDNMVESDAADYLLRSTSIAHLNHLGRLNLYFMREIEAGNGAAWRGGVYLSDRPGDEEALGIERLWRARVVTLAHEFGHILGLGHTPYEENVMFGYGTRPGSLQLESPQLRIMHHQARHLAPAEPIIDIAPHIDPDWRRDTPYSELAGGSLSGRRF